MSEIQADHHLIEILEACISFKGDRQRQARLEQTTPEEWESVFWLARRQGVAPLLYGCWQQAQAGWKIPALTKDHLRNAYLVCARDNVRLYKVVEEYLRALQETGIPVIPLKGTYLAEKVYGNIGWRPMVDVDLLIQRQDLRQAVEVAQKQGYQPGYAFDIEQECQVMHHLPALKKQDEPLLELHWNLVPPSSPFKINIGQVWQAARPGKLAGAEVLEMRAEDLLLHLCLHAAYLDYFSSGLRPICDITWTSEHFQENLDWERLAKQAKAWGAERNYYLAISITQRLLGMALPEDYLDQIRPEGYQLDFEDWAIQQIYEPSEIGGKLAQVWEPQLWLERGRHLVQNLFPPQHEIRQNYPKLAHGSGLFWAYLKHLGGIFRRNWKTAWKLISKDARVKAATEQREAINRLVEWQAGNSAHEGR